MVEASHKPRVLVEVAVFLISLNMAQNSKAFLMPFSSLFLSGMK